MHAYTHTHSLTRCNACLHTLPPSLPPSTSSILPPLSVTVGFLSIFIRWKIKMKEVEQLYSQIFIFLVHLESVLFCMMPFFYFYASGNLTNQLTWTVGPLMDAIFGAWLYYFVSLLENCSAFDFSDRSPIISVCIFWHNFMDISGRIWKFDIGIRWTYGMSVAGWPLGRIGADWWINPSCWHLLKKEALDPLTP